MGGLVGGLLGGGQGHCELPSLFVTLCRASTADRLPSCLSFGAAWIEQQQAAGQAPRSPLTGLPLEHLVLTPNLALRSLIASLGAGQLGAAAP